MRKIERKIIFETQVGSYLYGTNRPESDTDFMGVFLPSAKDLLGIENPPTEWSKNEKYSAGDRNAAGDVDRKYYSLKQFFTLLAEGQSAQLEMLFSPESMWTNGEYEWLSIVRNRDMFVSKGSIMPFIGFAKAQAYKATLKGDSLRLLRALIRRMETRFEECPSDRHIAIEAFIYTSYSGECKFCGADVTRVEVETRPGAMISCIEVAGRKFEFTQKAKDVYNKLRKLEGQYGTRSEAAAGTGYDYKSLMHAYRLLFEAKTLLTEGKLILPLPVDTANFLKSIRSGDYKTDFFQEIEDKLTELREIKDKSSLPSSVNRGRINELCENMQYEHLFEEKK